MSARGQWNCSSSVKAATVQGLKMQLGLVGDSVHYSYLLPASHLVSCLHIHLFEFTVESVVLPMLNQHTLIITWHHHHIAYLPVEDRPNRLGDRSRDIHAIVIRQVHILVNRMLVFTVTSYYSAIYRPRKIAFISRELL